jgi:two-component system, OmpR family, phosphate regulon response regulator PhoB
VHRAGAGTVSPAGPIRRIGASAVEQRVLVVEDEPAIRDMIAFALKRASLVPMLAEDARKAQHLIAERLPDLILLDWMLPGTSGLELARRLRREDLTREIPIIMLTARGEEDDRVIGLDAGVDDYVVKPFSTRELIARIRAVLRRTQPHGEGQTVSLGGLTLDTLSHRVFAGDRPVQLGPTEYRLLAFFMTHPERVYTRGQLLDNVWGSGVYVEERTVDVHIRRLRKSLEPFGLEAYVQTVRGAGYRFSTTV